MASASSPDNSVQHRYTAKATGRGVEAEVLLGKQEEVDGAV